MGIQLYRIALLKVFNVDDHNVLILNLISCKKNETAMDNHFINLQRIRLINPWGGVANIILLLKNKTKHEFLFKERN